MKRIIKNNEPNALTLYRSTPGANYENMTSDVKDELRKALYQEQGGICCYCMKRITTNYDSIKIEHFKPRNKYNGTNGNPNLKLTYSNLFLACLGKDEDEEGNSISCCDTKKGEKELIFINPLDPSIEEILRYTSNGYIYNNPQNIDCKPMDLMQNNCIDRDLNVILNLNNQSLKKLRKQVYEYIDKQIKAAVKAKKCDKTFLTELHKRWYKPDKDGKFKPFCMVAVYVIKKKLKELEYKKKA